jgi:hypothetical protein
MENKVSVIGKEISWDSIDGKVCRVVKFSSFGKIENNKVLNLPKTSPYASLLVECNELDTNGLLFIFHKLDFFNFCEAFKQKKENEVLIIWTAKHYKNFVYKILSSIMPKLIVWVCQKGAYELMTDRNYKPELSGEARFLAEKPIKEWKPEIMN